ncbi:hypothetical protein VDGL01_07279 [Verticillium dahliae]
MSSAITCGKLPHKTAHLFLDVFWTLRPPLKVSQSANELDSPRSNGARVLLTLQKVFGERKQVPELGHVVHQGVLVFEDKGKDQID